MYNNTDHTFVVCAYKESRYLGECIESLLKQTVETNIILATSTPCEYIQHYADMYSLELYINHGETGIAGDWNFALSCADTPLVTIAHQDDIYEPQYAEMMLKCMNSAGKPILFSSDYGEIRNGEKIFSNKLLNIKKVLRIPMRLFPDSISARRLSLAFGDSISCPTVTYVKEIILQHPFRSGMFAALDWQQWETLSSLTGTFVYCPKPLMCHRIHEESETSRVIGENGRGKENYEMFLKFWPAPIAKCINFFYSDSDKSNHIEKNV